MAGMLYYPFANPPLPVLHQAVLYWDNLSTVVAPGWRDRLTDSMRQLDSLGFYQPLEPYHKYEPLPLEQIAPELDAALAQVPLDDLLPPARGVEGDASTLHTDKLHPSVVEELLRKRLVSRMPGSPNRLLGSQALIHVVVSLVAGRIAAGNNGQAGWLGPTGLHPHTDRQIAHQLGTAPLSGLPTAMSWQVDIGGLLPVPQHPVVIDDLVAFRTRYDDERQRLMIAIQELLQQLQHTHAHPRDVLLRVQQTLAEAAKDLRNAAKATRRSWMTRGLAVTVVVTAAFAAGMPPVAALTLPIAADFAVNIATNPIRRSAAGAANGSSDYLYLHRTAQEINKVE